MGGWTFAPWDETFYPERLPKSRQLAFATGQVPTIEVNGTYYSTMRPSTFSKWASEAPEGFVYSLKGTRYATNRRILAEAGESVMRFVGSGITELAEKLGPILWQFAPHKKFDADDFEGFLKLLPANQDGVRLQHAVEVRHESFAVPDFVELLRRFDIPVVFADHVSYPAIADVTGDFVYARLQKGSDDIATCYDTEALEQWAARSVVWAQGGQPQGLPLADATHHAPVRARDVYVYFIHSGKVRAPHGAMALMERLAA